jgi:hypothetical protein
MSHVNLCLNLLAAMMPLHLKCPMLLLLVPHQPLIPPHRAFRLMRAPIRRCRRSCSTALLRRRQVALAQTAVRPVIRRWTIHLYYRY